MEFITSTGFVLGLLRPQEMAVSCDTQRWRTFLAEESGDRFKFGGAAGGQGSGKWDSRDEVD